MIQVVIQSNDYSNNAGLHVRLEVAGQAHELLPDSCCYCYYYCYHHYGYYYYYYY